MKKIIGTLVAVCLINLVPFIMTVLMLLTKNPSNVYSIFLSIRSFASIPTSLVGFVLQYDLGEVWWVILNILVFGICIAVIKS